MILFIEHVFNTYTQNIHNKITGAGHCPSHIDLYCGLVSVAVVHILIYIVG